MLVGVHDAPEVLVAGATGGHKQDRSIIGPDLLGPIVASGNLALVIQVESEHIRGECDGERLAREGCRVYGGVPDSAPGVVVIQVVGPEWGTGQFLASAAVNPSAPTFPLCEL